MVAIVGFDPESMAKVTKRLSDMAARIAHFKAVDIGNELSAWQTEDMHRKRPFTMRSRRAGRAATKIRPHSKFEVDRAKRAATRAHRRHKPGPMHTSTRPILREELIDTLQTRMTAALHDKIHW